MTNREMSELFALMLLAYPNAEMFKGGIQKLGPTIKLWTASLSDVDYRTGEQAVVRVCNKCKFPPTIAEFREQADAILEEKRRKISAAETEIRSGAMLFGSLDAWYRALPQGLVRKAIEIMGGPGKLLETCEHNGKPFQVWRWTAFEEAFAEVSAGREALGGTVAIEKGGGADG